MVARRDRPATSAAWAGRTLIPTAISSTSTAATWLADRRVLVADDAHRGGPRDGRGAPDEPRGLDLSAAGSSPGSSTATAISSATSSSRASPAIDDVGRPGGHDRRPQRRLTLRAGFTTVRDVGTFRAFVDIALRDAIDAGWTAGPRMQCAGAYVTSPAAPARYRPGPRHHPSRRPAVRGRAHARRGPQKVRAIVGGGADLIKIIVTGAVLTRGTRPGVVEMDEPMIRAAVEQARRWGSSSPRMPTAPRGSRSRSAAASDRWSTARSSTTRASSSSPTRDVLVVADLYDGDWIAEEGARAGWPAETLAKNDATTEAQRKRSGRPSRRMCSAFGVVWPRFFGVLL